MLTVCKTVLKLKLNKKDGKINKKKSKTGYSLINTVKVVYK